jgi:lipoyl(octanoyl) transferase
LISVLQLGTLDYETGLRLQQKLVNFRKDGRIGDVLLLLEHTPVITLGRNAKEKNILTPAEELSARGVEVFESDRGGDVTFHGPGQIVGYPIFDLRGFAAEDGRRKTLGVIEYVRRLEEVLIRTCGDFGIPACRVAGLTGVWTQPEGGAESGVEQSGSQPDDSEDRGLKQGKIAAIGVHISRSVTSHGFALNVNTDLAFFDLIVPCGIAHKPVTSMAKELGRALALEDVQHTISRNFGKVFREQMLWLPTLEALFGETVGVPMKEPEELRKLHGDEDTFWA